MMKAPALVGLFLALIFAVQFSAAVVYHDYYGPYGGDEWTTWEEDFLKNNKSHATPPFAPRQTFGGCYIATSNGLLEDLDCDKVPDIVDNCIGIPNPEQSDQNQNGMGDSCDLIVDRIIIDPPVVLEGRSFTVTATLTNYRPYDLRNIELTLQVPELGLEQTEYVDVIKAGDQEHYEFFLRIPECARTKDYDAVLFITWPKSPGVQESFFIPARMGVQSSGTCEEGPGPVGKTIINILDIQDIDPERGGDYPFTIVNNEAESQAYVLSVEGTDGWGSYQIQPRSLIVVPAGGTSEGLLTIYADKGATGEHGFVLTLRSKNDAKQVLLSARIKQSEQQKNLVFAQFGLFIAAAIIILVGGSFAAKKIYEERQREERNKEKRK